MNKKYIFLAATGIVIIGSWLYLVNKWKTDWYMTNAELGKNLGYPDCCIKEFCNQPPLMLRINGVTEVDRIRYEASLIDGEYSGFIPCAAHAKKIISGEIKLQNLIKNRDSQFGEFPNL